MCVWSEVLGGFWVGSVLAIRRKSRKTWSWRRGLNPRPSDYKSSNDLESTI